MEADPIEEDKDEEIKEEGKEGEGLGKEEERKSAA